MEWMGIEPNTSALQVPIAPLVHATPGYGFSGPAINMFG